MRLRPSRHGVRSGRSWSIPKHQSISTAIAVASPPPMQSDATPRLRPCLRNAPRSVTTSRAPEAPIGCPNAQAPPCTFNLSGSSPRSCSAAIATTANASLISKRSVDFSFQPVNSNSFRIAPTGADGNCAGIPACVVCPTIRAIGERPCLSAWEARIKTIAAAPSDIDDELAAVTVPFFAKAALSVGIRSISTAKGPSSLSMMTLPARLVTLTGITSQSKPPSVQACLARRVDRIAKSSCTFR